MGKRLDYNDYIPTYLYSYKVQIVTHTKVKWYDLIFIFTLFSLSVRYNQSYVCVCVCEIERGWMRKGVRVCECDSASVLWKSLTINILFALWWPNFIVSMKHKEPPIWCTYNSLQTKTKPKNTPQHNSNQTVTKLSLLKLYPNMQAYVLCD